MTLTRHTLPRNLLAVCLAVLAGCASTVRKAADQPVGPGYKLSNVSKREGGLPKTIRRVVLMPMTRDQISQEMIDGGEEFESALATELTSERQLETVRIPPNSLRRILGRHFYRSDEPLPPAFLKTLQRDPGADAALFIHLKGYRAYPPLMISASLRLVSLTDGEVLWAADETFDASNPLVTADARRHRLAHQAWVSSPLLEDSKMALQSPRLFCDYAALTLVKTMPAREMKPEPPQVSAKDADKKIVRIGN